MKKHSRYTVARRCLLFWCLFIGIGALAGSIGMLSAPDGSALQMQEMLPYFQVLPFASYLFQDYIFPGIALLCVNGIPNLCAAILLWKKKKTGVLLGGCLGITLMAWITIQFVIFPFNLWSTSFFLFGMIQAATGYAAMIFYKQEHFLFDPSNYPHVGSNPQHLVVYFSRLGYTRKIAYETAEKSGASLYEITTSEPTAGTLGFWWCGRFAMHQWGMPVSDCPLDLIHYEKVTICTPIWAFSICAPVRSFLKQAKGQLRQVDFVLVHHQPWRYEAVAKEMDELLGMKHHALRSVACHAGVFREIPVAEK